MRKHTTKTLGMILSAAVVISLMPASVPGAEIYDGTGSDAVPLFAEADCIETEAADASDEIPAADEVPAKEDPEYPEEYLVSGDSAEESLPEGNTVSADDILSANLSVSDNDPLATPDELLEEYGSVEESIEFVGKEMIYTADGCDFKVTVEGGAEGDVFYAGGGYYSDLSGNSISDVPGTMFIYTCKPVTIEMKDGVERTNQRISVGYYAHGVDDCAHITLKDVKIDRSELVPYITPDHEPYADSEWTDDGIGIFTAFCYLGRDDYYSSVTLTLEGDNELIGPSSGSIGSKDYPCYGIYIKGKRGLGIKGDGHLKASGGAGNGIKLVYGAIRIEEGWYDVTKIEMDQGVKGIITGGYFKEGNVPTSTVYGITSSRERFGPDYTNIYATYYNQDDATREEYPYVVVMTDAAKAWLGQFMGRRILYEMSEDYGRAYDTVYAAAREFKGGASFNVDYHLNNGFSMAETGMIKNAVVNDHPEFIWWWDSEWGGFSRGLVVNLRNPASTTQVEIARRTESFEKVSKALLYQAGITDEMSDLEKSYVLYQKLISHVKYNLAQGDQSAYEAVVDGEAVCAGYAKAYVYLLQQAGIEAAYVPGHAIPEGGTYSQGHAWVILKLDGKYYHSDPTWDDKGSTSPYKYFNVPWSTMKSSKHYIDDDLGYALPSATSAQRKQPSSTVHISAGSGAGGKAYPTSLNIKSGGAVRFTIVPDVGQRIKTVKVNGSVKTPTDNGNGTYSVVLTNVTADAALSVSFENDEYELIKYEAGDFMIYKTYGGELSDLADYYTWEYQGTTILTIKTGDPVTLEMKEGITSTSNNIAIQGSTVKLTLDNVVMDRTGFPHVTGGLIDATFRTLHLTLKGENKIIGCDAGNDEAICNGNTYNWAGYDDGELIIDGTGSLNIKRVKNAIEYTHLTVKDGKFLIEDCEESAFRGYMANQTNITGGYFGTGSPSAGTVYGSKVAKGCKVAATSDPVYKYKVTGGSTGTTGVKVTSVKLDRSSGVIYLGESSSILALTASVFPVTATDRSVSWNSSNENVATVDKHGVVRPLSIGEATITARANDGSGKSAKCKVSVRADVSELHLAVSDCRIQTGKTLKLIPSFNEGVHPDDKGLIWRSADATIATVDQTGKVKATAEGGGVVTITATSIRKSALSANCVVTVYDPVTSLAFPKKKISLGKGESAKGIKVKVLPETASIKDLEFESSDESVVSVAPAADGTVTLTAGNFAEKTKSAKITARTLDGSKKSAVCTVTVGNALSDIRILAAGGNKSLAAGKTLKLSAVLNNGNKNEKPADTALVWEIDSVKDENGADVSEGEIAYYATVDGKGVLKVNEPSQVVVRVTHPASNLTDTYEVRAFIPLKKLGVKEGNITLKEGRSDVVLTPAINPVNATLYDKDSCSINDAAGSLKWEVVKSDEAAGGAALVSVDEHTGALKAGLLPEGKTKGTATLKVTVKSDAAGEAVAEKSATCVVTVTKAVAVSAVKLDTKQFAGGVGSMKEIRASVAPFTADDKDITWESSDPSNVSVEPGADGTAVVKITDVPAGKKHQAVVTAKHEASGKKASCTVTVGGGVSAVDIKSKDTKLPVGKMLKLAASVASEDPGVKPANKAIVWEIVSANDAEENPLPEAKFGRVATIDAKGRIKAKGVGSVVVRASSAETPASGAKPCSKTIEIVTYVPVKKVSLSRKKAAVGEGKTGVLSASVTPGTAFDPSDPGHPVKWESTSEAVKIAAYSEGDDIKTLTFANEAVTHDGQQLIYKAVSTAARPVAIKATAADGSKKAASCKVTVRGRMKDAKLMIKERSAKALKKIITVTPGYDTPAEELAVADLPAGKKLTLTPSVTATAFDKSVTYRSENPSVVSVSNKGAVTAKGSGSTRVIMTTSDGGYTAACTITVP